VLRYEYRIFMMLAYHIITSQAVVSLLTLSSYLSPMVLVLLSYMEAGFYDIKLFSPM
jgi:hypothetical protein